MMFFLFNIIGIEMVESVKMQKVDNGIFKIRDELDDIPIEKKVKIIKDKRGKNGKEREDTKNKEYEQLKKEVDNNKLKSIFRSVNLMPTASSSDFEYRNVSGGVEITNYIGSNKRDISIPEKIDGKQVIRIGEDAFRFMDVEGSVVIPPGVTSIGKNAFYLNDITLVYVPNSVEKIEERAFYFNKISELNFQEGSKKIIIEDKAFESHRVVILLLPERVESIGKDSFLRSNISGPQYHSVVIMNKNLELKSNEKYFGDVVGDIVIGFTDSTAESYATSENNASWYQNIEPEIHWMGYGTDGGTWMREHEVYFSRDGAIDHNSLKYIWSTEKTTPSDSAGWEMLGMTDSITKKDVTGNYYLHIKAEGLYLDGIYNFRSDVHKFDNIEPSLSVSVNDASYTNGNVEITVKSSDSESGVRRIREKGGSWNNESSMTKMAASNGTYEFEVEDNAGNISERSITINIIDKTAPTISLSASTTSPTNGDVIITVSGSDAESGVRRIKLPNGTWVNGSNTTHKVTSNGTYEFTVEDNAGNITTRSINVTNIDKTNPTAPKVNAPTDWQNSNVSVSLTQGTDSGSGVNKTEYRLNGGSWTTYSNSFTISSNGETKIDARTIDNAGNVSSTDSKIVKIDKELPELSLTSSEVDWTNGNVTITAKGTDSYSGVKRIREVNGSWINGSSMTKSVTANGAYRFEVEDNAGNIREGGINIAEIDKVAPLVSLNPDGSNTYKQSHSTRLNIQDLQSGIKAAEYRWTNSSSFPTSNFSKVSHGDSLTTPNSTGKHYLHIRAEDNAGNVTEFTSNVFNVDRTNPEVTFETNGSTTYRKEQSTKVEVSDSGGSDVDGDKLEYAWSTSGSSTPTTWSKLTNNGTIKTEPTYTGRYYLWVKALDKAGNSTTATSNVFYVDNTKPEISVSKESGSYDRNHTVEISATDGHSRVDTLKYKWTRDNNYSNSGMSVVPSNGNVITPNESGEHYLHIEAVDNAGNIQTKTTSAFEVDQTEPIIKIDKNGDSTYKKEHATKITVNDEHSGVDKAEYQWTNSEEFPNSGSFNEFSESMNTKTPDGTGDHYLHVRALDKVGNLKEVSSSVFKVDQTNPEKPTMDVSEKWTNENVKVTLTDGSDEHSRPDKTEYRVNNDSWKTYNKAFDVSGEGENKVEARTVDKAGNIGEITQKTVRVDKTEVSLNVKQNTNDITHEDVELTLEVSDNLSGIERVVVTPEGTDRKEKEKVETINEEEVLRKEMSYTVINNGVFNIEVEDIAGNILNTDYEVDNIDKTASFEIGEIEDFEEIEIGKSEDDKYKTSFKEPINVKDWTDENDGWKLEVSATTFNGIDEENNFPQGSLILKHPESISITKHNEKNGTIEPKLSKGETPIDISGKTTLIEADPGESRGEFEVKFPKDALQVIVDPSVIYKDEYESTISWSYIAGP